MRAIVTIALLMTTAAAEEVDRPGLAMRLLRTINADRAERVKLAAGQAGVNGYAVFGDDAPKDLLTGDDGVDQAFSRAARLRILTREIAAAYRALMLLTVDAAGGDIDEYGAVIRSLGVDDLKQKLPALPGARQAPGDDVFALSMIQAVLHRQPAPQELAAATEKLDSGRSRDNYITGLFSSREYKKAGRSDEEYIVDVMQATAGRTPADGELSALRKTKTLNRRAFPAARLANAPPVKPAVDTAVRERQKTKRETAASQAASKHSAAEAGGGDEKRTWSPLVREPFEKGDGASRRWDVDNADDAEIDGGRLSYELEDDGDYVTYTVRNIPLDNVEITFRGRAMDSGFRVLVVGAGGLVGVVMGGDGNRRSAAFLGTDSTPVARAAGAVYRKKAWHTYRIRRIGPVLQAWCDGKKVLAATSRADVGGGGLLTFAGQAGRYDIDDLVVRTCVKE